MPIMPTAIRYFSGGIFLALAMYAAWDGDLSSVPEMLVFITLVAASVCLLLKALVDLLAFLFAHSAKSLGRFLGRCYAITRNASRD